MHDDIGAQLTKMRFLCELVKRDPDLPGKAVEEVDRMSDTARDVLKGFDEIVWAVNPKNDTLDNLANYLIRYAQEFFKDTAVQCLLDIPTQLPAAPLSTEVRHNLFLAVKEALNNILKHAVATEVRIQLRVEPHDFEVQVTDNGRGFDPTPLPSKAPAGNGLVNMRERLAAIGGQLYLCSETGKGTQITFRVSLQTGK